MKLVKKNVRSTIVMVGAIKVIDGSVKVTPLSDIVLSGTINEVRALSQAQREYKGTQVVVLGIEHTVRTVGMSEEDFMKYAHEITEEELSQEIHDEEID